LTAISGRLSVRSFASLSNSWMVRKEVWAHLLVYNLIRGVMAQAAQEYGGGPRQLSFTGALQAPRRLRGAAARRRGGQGGGAVRLALA
jgi:hypothetical protein